MMEGENSLPTWINTEVVDTPVGFDENAYIEEVTKTNFIQTYSEQAQIVMIAGICGGVAALLICVVGAVTYMKMRSKKAKK